MNKKIIFKGILFLTLLLLFAGCSISDIPGDMDRINNESNEENYEDSLSDGQELIARVGLNDGGYIDFIACDDDILAISGIFKQLPDTIEFNQPAYKLYESLTGEAAPEKLVELSLTPEEMGICNNSATAQDINLEVQQSPLSLVNSKTTFYTGRLTSEQFKQESIYINISRYYGRHHDWFDHTASSSVIHSDCPFLLTFAHCMSGYQMTHRIRYKKNVGLKKVWRNKVSSTVPAGYCSYLSAQKKEIGSDKFKVEVVDLLGRSNEPVVYHCASWFQSYGGVGYF